MSSPPLPPSNPLTPEIPPNDPGNLSGSDGPDKPDSSSNAQPLPPPQKPPSYSITPQQIADFHIVEACIDSVTNCQYYLTNRTNFILV